MPDTLADAGAHLLASLEPFDIVELGSLITNLKVPAVRQRIDWIADKIHLTNLENYLVQDIALRFPDEEVLKGKVLDDANGVFEAKIIL